MSGGQILKTIAEKALDLPQGEGLNFYDFDIADKKAFKTKYREALDTLTTDAVSYTHLTLPTNREV